MRGEPEIERLGRRFGVFDSGEIFRLHLQRGAEGCEHQVVEALLSFGLGLRVGQQVA